MAKKNMAWSGRFKHEINRRFLQFSQSIGYDRRLALYDIAAGIAHVEMLAGKGIIPRKHAARILAGLKKIAQEFFTGKFKLKPECEDIHMNIESRLFELIGEPAGGLHTGRSRNDLVLTDLRLWLKDALGEVISLDKRLIQALAQEAGRSLTVIMPGFTHTREAQPILFSHWLLAYAQMFVRDGHRLMEVYDHADLSPLGSGALAGSNFPLDRELTARRLGFAGVTANSLDSVSDRDFVLEFLFAASVLMMHLSRLAEELIWFSGEGYGFFELPESLCTGSSIMPNKKNPDAAELLRGKAGRVYGHLFSLLTVMKATPLAYNRDFQEDKEPLFDAADTIRDCLAIAGLLVSGLKPVPARMKAACEKGFMLATDLADYLVMKGLGFRQAHHAVGGLVKYCEARGKKFEELELAEFKAQSPLFGRDLYPLLSAEKSVAAKNVTGGTAPGQVKKQISRLKTLLREWGKRF